MTTLANARSTRGRATSPRLLTIAKAVSVLVALGYLGLNALGLYWMRGYNIAWTWGSVLEWLLPPTAATLALVWTRAGGVAFLLAAGFHLYRQIDSYRSMEGEEWQPAVGDFLFSIAWVVLPALLAGALLLIADRRARLSGARAAAPSGPGAR